jgi:hypothetical protein
MSARAKAQSDKIDRLMEEASEALVAMRYFDAERTCVEALSLAHQGHDYERMGRIVMPLQEARRQRRQMACDVKKLIRIEVYSDLEVLLTGAQAIKPGCYLLAPPLVGADARELRERALADNIPVLVAAREPETRLGLWPIVTVGPLTVRTKIPPPKKIDASWVQKACESLGDAAVAQIDPGECAADRVDHVMELLAAVVDHEKLHQSLRSACDEAHRDAVEEAARPKRASNRKVEEEEEFVEDDEV